MKRKIGITLAILIVIGAITLGIYKFSDKITEIAKVSQTDKPYALSGNTDAWNFVYKAYVEQVRKDENRTSGTLVDRKDRATAANGYLIERSDVGKQIDFSWYTLMTKRNTYCMQKGTDVTYGFPLLDYTVKYYANINENSEIDYSGTIGDVKNGTKERYLYALSYILADGKTCNHRDGKYLSYNSCYHQKAMWRLVYDWGGIGTDVKLDLNNSEDRKAYQLANEARAYGRYMYSRMNNGTNEFTTGKAYSINRESSDEDKNKINGYSILGVYRVYYPSTTFGEGTFKVSVGGIKEVTGINDKIYICNKNGEKIEPTELKSGDKFYIACKQGEKGTITFKFNTVKAVKNAEIYYLSNSYNQDMLIGDATFDEKNESKSISVQADKAEPIKGEYTININKIDSQNNSTKLDGSVFGIYKVDTKGNETLKKLVWPSNSASGSYNITIDESDYLESQANDGLKYRIQEMRAPSGYMKTSGFIELTLPIKINSNNKYEVDIPHINSTNFSLPNPAKVKYDTVKGTNITFDIPNIKYPEYEILLNKNYTDENGNPINATNELLQETVFKVEAYEKDGDNIINNNVIGSYNLSNDTNISKYITSMGKFTINIQDGKLKTNIILEKEDMYIRITEVNSPKEYTILEKPIEIGIKSQLNNGVYTIKDITTNDVKRVSYKDINNTRMTINVINEKITQEKPTELQITKYTYEEVEGSSTPIERKLDGVVFGIFNEKGEKLKEVTTNSDGIATYPIEYKNSIKDWNIKEYGKNSDSIKLIIKEIKEAEGYRKLSDDDQIEVEIKFGINETGNAIITNEIDVKYQMDAQGHIEINVYKKNDDGNYKIIGSNNYRTQIVNKELENVNGADWQNNQSNYDQTMFISEYEGKMRVNFKVPNYKEIKEGETSLKIKKVDSQTGETLEGVEFGIFDELGNGIYGNDDNNSTELNKPIATGTTNSDGIAILKIDLREKGNKSYYIKEIGTLNNYEKLTEDQYIIVNLDIEEEFKAFGSHTYTYTYKVNNMEIINVLNSDKDIDVMLSNNNDDKITLKSVNYSPEDGENVKTSVELSEGFDNICIKVPNDKIVQDGKYYLQIEKVDDNDNTKKLKGAEFKLYNELQEEIGTYETDDDGAFTIKGDITENDYNNEWIKLYLKETKAPIGYQSPEGKFDIEIILHISKNKTHYYADRNATVINYIKNIKIKSGSNEVQRPGEIILSRLNNELDNGEGNPFELTIPNKEAEGTYKINLEKVDALDNTLKLSGAKFNLKNLNHAYADLYNIDPQIITGSINYSDFEAGVITLELEEITAPSKEYEKLNGKIHLYLTVAEENGRYYVNGLTIRNTTDITIKACNTEIPNDGYEHRVENYDADTEIKLMIPNEKKYTINLKKVDSNNTEQELEGAVFKLIDRDTKNVLQENITTDSDGEITIRENITKAEEIRLSLVETNAPDGYIKFGEGETIDFDLTNVKSENGYNIEKVKITNNTKIKIKANNEEIESKGYKEFNNLDSSEIGLITIPNEPVLQDGDYSINLEKVNSKNSEEGLGGAIFIPYKLNDQTTLDGVTTGSDGKATIRGTITTDDYSRRVINLTLKETNAPDGYIGLSNDEYIQLDLELGRDEENNKYCVENVIIHNDTNVTIKALKDNQEQEITNDGKGHSIDYNTTIGLKIPNEPVLQDGEYRINLRKVNSKNSEEGLNGAEFEVSKINDNTTYTITTNSNDSIDGIATISGTITTEDYARGVINLSLKETKAPNGYIGLGNKEIKLDLKIGKDEGNNKYCVENITIHNNTDVTIKALKDNQEQDIINDGEGHSIDYNTTIRLKIPNEPEATNGEYVIKLHKVGQDNQEGLKDAVFLLNNSELPQTDGNGEIRISGQITKEDYVTKTINLSLTEKTPPSGYKAFTGAINLELKVGINETENKYCITEIKVKNNTNINITLDNTQIEKNKEATITDINDSNIGLKIPNEPIINDGEFKLDLRKVDAALNEKVLKGAEFTLTDEFGNQIGNKIKLENGTATVTMTITEDNYKNNNPIKLKLSETKAPEGYNKLDGTLDLELSIDIDTVAKKYFIKDVKITNNTNIDIKSGDRTIEKNGGIEEIGKKSDNITLGLEIPNTNIDLALKKFIIGVTDNNGNYTATTGREPNYNTESLKTTTEATYTFNKDNPVEVAHDNIVRYTIRIYNEGSSDGYASLIKDYLPNGVELVSGSESDINRIYGWKENEDSNGRYISTRYLDNKMINKYNGGEELDYKDVQVELRVTMKDSYDGTLKNVAEIAEMKNEGGTVITKDRDSSTEGTIITRDGNTINNYNPKEDDIDYDWIKLKDGIPFGGRVWLDVPPPNTKAEINNLLDSHESFTEIENNGGVMAYLCKKDKDGNFNAVAETQVNSDGTYKFEDVKKSDGNQNYNEYLVVFAYNGMRFTNVEANVGGYENIKINSKAEENSEDRETFNYKFRTINNTSGINYTQTQEGTRLISKYDYNIGAMTIFAKTRTYSLGAMNNLEELQYINLGLKYRPSFDMALYKDVSYATVTVNGQQEKYTYDRYSSYNSETQTFDEFSYTVRQTDYDFGVRKIDTTEEAGLNIDVTYKIKILNQSSIWGNISKIVDYYDSHYKFIGAELRNNANETLDIPLTINTNESAEIRGNGANYHSMNIEIPQRAETILGNNESLYIYITLRFKNPTEALNSLSDTSSLRTMNIAEIAEYSTYEKDTTDSRSPGLIDIDSAPGNFNITGYKKEDYLEDDTGAAPALTYTDNNKSVRTLTGNVFEDIENAENINIKDIKVELIETNASGEPIMEGDEYRRLTYKVTTTDENGNYTFENFLPGYYIIRFSYGERKETVLINSNGGSNEHSYNGQDYESTEYNLTNYSDGYWYKTVTDKSDAQDVAYRRGIVNDYSKEYTNKIASVLNAWKANPIDEEKVNELIAKTGMYADTAKMKLSVEFGTEEINPNNVEKDDEGNIIYAVTGIDFGLKARPTNDIEIIKQISKINVLDSNNNTLISATRDTKNNVLWLDDSFVKAELSDELINGATIQVEYTISLVNRGNVTTKVMEIVDYVDNGLLFDSNSNEQWEVIEASNLKGDNGLVDNNINLANRNVILKAKADKNPLIGKDMNPGQKLEDVSTVTLTKKITTSNSTVDDLSYENMVEILKTSNDIGRKTESTPGNLNPEDPEFTELDDDIAESFTISNPTGQTRIYYVLGITVAIILIAGILGIKKFVIGRKD